MQEGLTHGNYFTVVHDWRDLAHVHSHKQAKKTKKQRLPFKRAGTWS